MVSLSHSNRSVNNKKIAALHASLPGIGTVQCHITQGTVTWACIHCHPSCSAGAGKRSKGDMYHQSIHRYLSTADKNLVTFLSASGMEFNVVGTDEAENFYFSFTLYLSTFLHLTFFHHSHSLGSYWSYPGSHLHVRTVELNPVFKGKTEKNLWKTI